MNRKIYGIVMGVVMLSGLSFGQIYAEEFIKLITPKNMQVLPKKFEVRCSLPKGFDKPIYLKVGKDRFISVKYKGDSFSTTVEVENYGTNALKIAALMDKKTMKSISIYVVNKLYMTPGGWMFMIIAWAVIIALVVFAFIKILNIKKGKIVEPLDIDTKDGD